MPLLLQEKVEEEEEEDVPCEMPTAAIAPCRDLHLSLASWAVAVSIPPFHLPLPLLLVLLPQMNLLHPQPQQQQ